MTKKNTKKKQQKDKEYFILPMQHYWRKMPNF